MSPVRSIDDLFGDVVREIIKRGEEGRLDLVNAIARETFAIAPEVSPARWAALREAVAVAISDFEVRPFDVEPAR